VLLIKL